MLSKVVTWVILESACNDCKGLVAILESDSGANWSF